MKLVRDGFIIREARGYLRSDYEKYEWVNYLIIHSSKNFLKY